MTNSIKDVCEDSQVILLVGSNPEEAHPVMGMRLRQAVERGAKLIVVDPLEIGLAKKADIHLKLRPGTNVAFANGMVNVLIQRGLVDREFVESRTEGFDELAAMVADYTPERVAEICGIDARDLEAAAEMYATAERAPIVYCLGVVEHSTGTEGVMALSNLALATGKLGRPGCGINPLRGQNNVQGACDMLGYDVLQVANEGKMVCVVAPEDADAALAAMRANKYGADAAIIGEVSEAQPERGSKVFLRTAFGGTRILDMLVGEQLPRIC